jgi:hypothetical protein
MKNILDFPKFFTRIVDDTMTIIRGNNSTYRPIEIDLIQKIVFLINALTDELNLELYTFRLLLSKQMKSLIEVFILILLTIFYYGEQKNYFNQQILTLKEQKSSLLNYFISRIVP